MLDELKRSVKESPIVDMGDYHYFIHPLSDGLPLVRSELLKEVVDAVIDIADLDCDYILTAQSMGFPLAAALAMKTDLPYKFIRKRKYGLEDEVPIKQVTGYSENEMYLNFVEEGDRVLIIDDVLSTGGTLRGIIETLKDMDVEICDVVVIFEKAGQESDIREDLDVDIKSLLKIEIEDGEVNILGNGF